MKINDDHLYHGAALTQVAEHSQFTAINAFKSGHGISRSGFLVNNDVGLYLKYATKPHGSYREYKFNFNLSHLKELAAIEGKSKNVFIAFVCVQDRQIGCLSREELLQMIEERKTVKGAKEPVYTVLITCPQGKKLRAYINAPDVKKIKLTEKLLSRSDFPKILFE